MEIKKEIIIDGHKVVPDIYLHIIKPIDKGFDSSFPYQEYWDFKTYPQRNLCYDMICVGHYNTIAANSVWYYAYIDLRKQYFAEAITVPYRKVYKLKKIC